MIRDKHKGKIDARPTEAFAPFGCFRHAGTPLRYSVYLQSSNEDGLAAHYVRVLLDRFSFKIGKRGRFGAHYGEAQRIVGVLSEAIQLGGTGEQGCDSRAPPDAHLPNSSEKDRGCVSR